MANNNNYNANAPFGNQRLQHWKTIPIDATDVLNTTFDLIVPTDPTTLVFPEVVWFEQTRGAATYQTSPVIGIVDSGGNALATALTVGTATNQGKFAPVRPTSGSYVPIITGGLSLQAKITTAGVGVATATRARTDNIATIVTGSAHGLLPGDDARVLAMTDTSFNGLQKVLTVPSTTSFTFANAGADVVSGADVGGSVGVRSFLAHVFALYF